MATERSDNVRKEKNRRSNKPLMEKKRRERINKSLNELKEIVLRAQNKDASKFTKLEKADILDLTVKHLQRLDKDGKISPNIKNTECEKYRQGFEKCLIEVENYIKNDDNLYHLKKSKQIISHLKALCSKIPPEEVCRHTSSQTNKIKATVDTSVFRSPIISHTYPEEQRIPTAVILPQHQNEQRAVPSLKIPSPFPGEHILPTAVIAPQPGNEHHRQSPKSLHNNFYNKQGNIEYSIRDTRAVVVNYPPSPPDSLRYSSSPDSLRGSSPRSGIEFNPNTNPLAFEKQISPTPFMECSNYSIKHESESENKPLNLTVPSNTPRQENLLTIYHPVNKPSSALQSSSSSSSSVNVKREPPLHSHPNYIHPSFQQRYSYNNYFMSNAQDTTKEGGPSRASHSSCNRTAPYPKKEVVKRYHNENSPLGDAEGEGGQRNQQNAQANLQHVDLAQSHWRPW